MFSGFIFFGLEIQLKVKIDISGEGREFFSLFALIGDFSISFLQ